MSHDHHDGLPDLVTRANIARRLHMGRVGAKAATSAPDFPAPIGRLRDSPVWRWAEVSRWAQGATGSPGGPTPEAMRLAGIRDHFREAGFRLKIVPDGDGWKAIRVAVGRPSSAGEPFVGDSALQAAERALEWLQTHH